jgi:hypothetical protein
MATRLGASCERPMLQAGVDPDIYVRYMAAAWKEGIMIPVQDACIMETKETMLVRLSKAKNLCS